MCPHSFAYRGQQSRKDSARIQPGLKVYWDVLEATVVAIVFWSELTDEDVEADHLQNFIDNLMYWMATTQFPTRVGYLDKSSKVTYFSYAKSVWKSRLSLNVIICVCGRMIHIGPSWPLTSRRNVITAAWRIQMMFKGYQVFVDIVWTWIYCGQTRKYKN